MDVKVYWLLVATVIILGMILPQRGRKRKFYIVIMTTIQIFVCGFRYMYLTGDLRKYAATYYELPNHSWFSEYAWHDGRNAGFYWLMKYFSELTGENFQVFLFFLAVVTQICLAILVYEYSSMPWLSYLVWNCMAFFVTYDFISIKQGLAMALLMLSMICCLEQRFVCFLIITVLAGFIHMPALCFLPAYYLVKQRLNYQIICLYILSAIAIFAFRGKIVNDITEFYYAGNDEIEFFMNNSALGGRVIVICFFLIVAFLMKGFCNRRFEGVFNIIIVAAIFQMFSGYNNVFTRLADYYLQFLVLLVPLMFYDNEYILEKNSSRIRPLLFFNDRSITILVIGFVLVMIWWYWKTCLGVTITYAPDDYTKFKFMWEVVENSAGIEY